MKLVDILARELTVWPEDADYCVQDEDHEVRFAGTVAGDFFASVLAEKDDEVYLSDGIPYAGKVTKAQWQAAVDALNAPTSAEWNGSGLPPVGTVCEWSGCTSAAEDPKEPDLHIGDQVKIIAHFKDGEFELAAFTFNPQLHNADRGTAWVNQGAFGCFRKIRTPEQTAAEERDKAINQMEFDTDCLDRGAFTKLYDAGWRKQVKP